jgi:hypothetical protein
MTPPAIILAIPILSLLVVLWTIWRCVLRRPRPSTAPIELSCGVAVVWLLMAASAALSFSDRVVLVSFVRGGPAAWFEWIPGCAMVFYVFLAGGFFGAAALQGTRRSIDGADTGRERRPSTEARNALD